MNRSAAPGFTLVELMFVIGVMAIMAGLAVPAFSSFYIRNATSALANNFSSDLLRARSIAVARNTCVAICRSTTVNDPGTAVVQKCAGSRQADWQDGWLVFVNPECDPGVTTPATANLISIVNAANPNLVLKYDSPKDDYLMFSATGLPQNADAGGFTLKYGSKGPSSDRRICLNRLGRVATIDITEVCP